MATQITRQDFDRYMVPVYAPADFIVVRGQGARLWDQQDREYIDFAGGIAVNALGHAHPVVVNALQQQSQKLWHLGNGYTNEPALALAQQFIQHTFAEKVFFCNSGAEANEAALKLARKFGQAHGKHQIVAFDQAFHGRTLFTVSVGGQAKYSQPFAPLPEGIVHCPFNDISAAVAAIGAQTCAVIVEPIQGEGGVIPANPEFLQALRQACDQHGALLIFDEVQTGVGRTGYLYAYQQSGVIPDVLTTAKALGAGFPIGAMLTTDVYAQVLSVGDHGSTYGGNPLACAVAGAVLDYVCQPEILQGVQRRAAWFIQQLTQLNTQYPIFSAFRGQGLLIGCVLKTQYEGQAKLLLQCAAQQGVMLLMAGPNVVRLTPALIIPISDINEGMVRLGRALADFLAHVEASL